MKTKISGESMEYNIYLDVFFLLNLIMNAVVIKMASWILRRKCRWKRLFLSAAAGTIFNCAFLLMGIDFPGTSLVVATAMSMISFGKKKGKELAALSIFLCFMAFCLEGAITWLNSLGAIPLVLTISYLIGKERKKQEQEMTVILTFKGRQKELKGFYDSGNLLTEPITGKMVHIACYDEVKELLPETYRQVVETYFNTGFFENTKVTKLQMYEFTFLSYHSIGNETGQLLGIRMDSADFMGHAGKKTEEKAVIGLANQKLFVRGHGRMIINGRLEL